jgi:hypothetical protein
MVTAIVGPAGVDGATVDVQPEGSGKPPQVVISSFLCLVDHVQYSI